MAFQNVSILLAICMLLYFVTGLHITMPEDPNGAVYLCSDHDCFSMVVRSASVDGGLLITMMVHDFTKDPRTIQFCSGKSHHL